MVAAMSDVVEALVADMDGVVVVAAVVAATISADDDDDDEEEDEADDDDDDDDDDDEVMPEAAMADACDIDIEATLPPAC